MGAVASAEISPEELKRDYVKEEGKDHFKPGFPGRLRVLCLHGYGSNNDITQLQTNNLLLKKHGVSCDMLQATTETWAQNETLELLSPGDRHLTHCRP